MSRSRWFSVRLVALLAVLALIVAACGGDAGDDATTTTTASTTETTAAGTDTTTTTAAPSAEEQLLESAKNRSFRIGITGEGVFHRDGRITGYQLNKLPMALAVARLNEEGWDIAPIFLNQSEAPVQALIQGSVDVANSSVTPVITAIAAGGPVVTFAKTRSVEYVMLTTSDIEGPEDLDGRRVGLHANASTTTLLTKLFLKDHPEVEPDYLIVPGSGNRIQAMLAGELDATAAQFGDDTAAIEAAPGDFHVIFDFAKELPELVDSVYSYNPAEIDDETRLFMEYLLAYTVEFNRRVYDDPAWALEAATQAEVSETGGLDRYIESGVFPLDHGLSPEALDLTIQGLIDAELISSDGAPGGQAMYDGSIWEGAQRILGE
jgi:NitT/TauT family transport system substrate-binding protein